MRIVRPRRPSATRLAADRPLGIPLPARGLGPQELTEWTRVASRSLDWSGLEPLLRFDPGAYARIPLCTTSHWELVAVCWLPGQGTPIHDHGGCCGASLVLAGALTETTYRISAGRLQRLRRRRLVKGQAMLERAPTIHQVENRSRSKAISLHLYSPPLGEVRVFGDAECRRVAAEALGLPPPW